ncbi:uncharacterized protein LOC119100435 [Pollicipes pollicipes]|uniref:uncharacterized protein LOC119100435 n=1 Tax=Pollicipes pollicipes TaxID=41117 RepID=UPI00188515C2|nr:uncharacterized protein LOC119100435 [Pollicipes pollicipes]
MSSLGDGDRPMVWMNEIIDVAGSTGLGPAVHGAVCRALAAVSGHASNPDWLVELMGQMRAVQTGKAMSDAPADQVLAWLADVLVSALLLWSPLALVAGPVPPADARAQWDRLLPAAARLLLELPPWKPLRAQICGWLQRLQEDTVLADRLRLPLLLSSGGAEE